MLSATSLPQTATCYQTHLTNSDMGILGKSLYKFLSPTRDRFVSLLGNRDIATPFTTRYIFYKKQGVSVTLLSISYKRYRYPFHTKLGYPTPLYIQKEVLITSFATKTFININSKFPTVFCIFYTKCF